MASKFKRYRVWQQRDCASVCKRFAQEEIPVAMQEKNRLPARCVFYHLETGRLEITQGVVTNPNLEKITQNEHRVSSVVLHVGLPGLKSGFL